MIYLLLVPLVLWALFYRTWIYYIAFMSVKKNISWIKEHKFDYYSMMPEFILGYAMDILLQMTFGTIAFWEIPKEMTLSGRVVRHQKESKGWRLQRANYLCHRYLKPFDETHCK